MLIGLNGLSSAWKGFSWKCDFKTYVSEQKLKFLIFFNFLTRNGSQIVKNHLVNIQWTIRSHLWPILSIFQNFQFLEICDCSFNHQYFENFSILGQFWWIFWLSFNETWCFLPVKSIKHARAHKMKSEFKKLSKISIYLVNFFLFLAKFLQISCF